MGQARQRKLRRRVDRYLTLHQRESEAMQAYMNRVQLAARDGLRVPDHPPQLTVAFEDHGDTALLFARNLRRVHLLARTKNSARVGTVKVPRAAITYSLDQFNAGALRRITELEPKV